MGGSASLTFTAASAAVRSEPVVPRERFYDDLAVTGFGVALGVLMHGAEGGLIGGAAAYAWHRHRKRS